MRRLIDENLSPDSSQHWLAELVRAMPRLEHRPFAADRIFARVRSAATRRRRAPWLVGAVALGAGVSVAAAAQVAHFRVSGRLSAPFAGQPAIPTPSLAAPAAVAPPEVGGIAPPETLADTSAIRSKPQATPSARVRLSPQAVDGNRFAGGEDPGPLLEAIRTLRSNGDPTRAGVMLADYLKAYPHTLLLEDALALSIEAAVARHDSRSVADLSRRYMAQFPNGRYYTFVSRAAQPGAP